MQGLLTSRITDNSQNFLRKKKKASIIIYCQVFNFKILKNEILSATDNKSKSEEEHKEKEETGGDDLYQFSSLLAESGTEPSNTATLSLPLLGLVRPITQLSETYVLPPCYWTISLYF